MGLLTWIIIGVAVLAIIGLGLQTFFSGMWNGAQRIGQNSLVQNVTNEAKQGIKEIINNTTK
jgi:hypothetical protein